MALNPGDRIERYVIEALLGAGGMGEVYRAHDSRLQRAVALKILGAAHVEASRASANATGATGKSAPSSVSNPARMVREARAAAALDHPNVVAIFDVGEVESPEELRGTTYIAMELIKGSPLRSYVGDAGVAVEKRVAWLTDVARALAAAHAAGLVHRDIKPENVMIRDDGNVKVLDFGIAKRSSAVLPDKAPSTDGSTAGTLTAEGVVLGTPLYMAPEHMRGEAIDGRADQFSWGVVAYELLAGRSPWPLEGGPLAVLSQILSGMPPPLSSLSSAPPHVTDAVMRALAKDREARFASMDELVVALTGPAFVPITTVASLRSPAAQSIAMHGTPIEASHTAASPPIAPRRRWLAVAGIAAVAAASAGAFVVERARSSAPSTVVAPSPPPLRSCINRACVEAHGGEPYVCRASDHACVAVASQDCRPMFEPKDLLADDTVWIGAMFPTSGPMATAFGTMNMEGTNFARQEIAQATSALEGSAAATKVRPVALVECNDAGDAMRAARHLVDDVGVPAILGFRSGKEVTDLAGSWLIQRGVLAVASLTTAPQITRLPQPPNLPRMVWRTTYSLDAVAHAVARVIEGTLDKQKAARATHVTLVRPDTAGGMSFAEALYGQLHFNGKPALENGHDYQEVSFPNETGTEPDIARLADRVAASSPSFLILLGDTSTLVPLVEAVESRSKGVKPTYVVAGDSTESFTSTLGKNASLRHRLYAVDSGSNSNANARFVIRYNEAHQAQVTRELNAAVSYDAFYLLAYAAFAIGEEPVSGPSLARAFGRLVPPGAHIEVGPTKILEAIGTLSAGGRLDLQGASTSLDYDLTTGEDASDFVLLCAGVDADAKASGDSVESGVVVRAGSDAAEGVLRCP